MSFSLVYGVRVDQIQTQPAAAPLPESLRSFLGVPGSTDVVAKLNYSHKAMIDEIVKNPHVSQGSLASIFGYTPGWISQVIATDAFQAALAERKNEIIDPVLRATVEERLKGLVLQSIDKLMTKMEGNPSDDLTLGVLTAATKALGYGAKNIGPVINNQFVVQVPAKAVSSAQWASDHAPSAGGSVEVKPRLGIVDRDPVDAPILTERSGQTTTPAVPTQEQADLLLKELCS